MDLFEFNDDFIAAITGGSSDDDVTEIFVESIRAGAKVLEERLTRTAGAGVVEQARFVKGAFEIPLTQDQYDSEFGTVDEPPQAKIRRAVISSTIPASLAMSKHLNGD